MGNHDEFDLDVRLTSGGSRWASQADFAEDVPQAPTRMYDDSCITDCRATCPENTGGCHTCANTCAGCGTANTQCNQNTCAGCGTVNTQCNQNTCHTCPTQCGHTCVTCQPPNSCNC